MGDLFLALVEIDVEMVGDDPLPLEGLVVDLVLAEAVHVVAPLSVGDTDEQRQREGQQEQVLSKRSCHETLLLPLLSIRRMARVPFTGDFAAFV